jgi:hypothetical protein
VIEYVETARDIAAIASRRGAIAVAVWVAGLLDLPDEPGVAADGTVAIPRRPSARTINAKLGTGQSQFTGYTYLL